MELITRAHILISSRLSWILGEEGEGEEGGEEGGGEREEGRGEGGREKRDTCCYAFVFSNIEREIPLTLLPQQPDLAFG
jgi:hypothetical protein